VEPFHVVKTGEAHRNFWKPKEVRVLLLAESHVYTSADECLPMHGPTRYGPKGVPMDFIRLVYCLGYGEPSYVGWPTQHNPGTWQYWKIFSSCIHAIGDAQFGSILKRNTPVDVDRFNIKIDLLSRLKKMGVWLVDSSVLALYTPRIPKPSRQIRDRVLQTCWDEYIGRVVSTERPRRIIVIGQEVALALQERISEVTKGEHITIPQPQGLRSKDAIAHAYRKYHSECRQHCRRTGAA